MNDFIRRIRRLQKQLGTKAPSVTLVYEDGTEVLVGGSEALGEILKDHSIVDIRCANETGQSFFSALLEAEQECRGNFDDLNELWR